jgi:hypothetical protein
MVDQVGKRFSFDDVKVEIIQGKNLTIDEQVKRIQKLNDIFVDIAVKYHVDKIKGEKKNEKKKQ